MLQVLLIIVGVAIAIPIILVVFIWLAGIVFSFTSVTNKAKHTFVSGIFRLVCFLMGVDVTVEGKENLPNFKGNQGVAIVANHESNFDVLVLAGFIKGPVGFMAKKEIAKWPIIGRWAQIIGCTFIDRSNLRQSYNVVMGQTRERIGEGMGMVVFPAGTRSKSNEVLPFKAGSFKVATSIGAPILPVTLEDVYLAPKASILHRVKVKMIIHPLVEKADYDGLKSFDLAKQIEDEIKKPILTYQKIDESK